MSVSVEHGREIRINPAQSETDVVGRIFRSSSDRFIASLTDSIVTIHCVANGGISFVGSLDVGDIVDSAGEDFAETEGSFQDVVFDPSDSLVFISTIDSLVGVVRIERFVKPEDDAIDEPGGFIEVVSAPFGDQEYTMKLITVLLFPIPRILLAPSVDYLYVVGIDKRVLFLIDWKNYQARARRFIIPPLGHHGDPGSPCVNSVLPQTSDADLTSLKTEEILVSQVVVAEEADSLILLYENGMLRCLALSRPSEQMCSVLQCPPARCIAVDKTKLAIASDSSVYVFELMSHTSSSLKFKTQMASALSSLSWSHGYLSVATRDGVHILNRQGTGALVTYDTSESCKEVLLSLPMRLMAIVYDDSVEVEIVSLQTSSDFFTNSFSELQSQLLMGRDSLHLYTFPAQQLRHISGPVSYIQENGLLSSACIQINHSSKFILAVAEKGFALWSSSVARREGRWEVLPDKSQEARLGKIDVFGFLSDTVFFTHSEGSKDMMLWSVLKRIDLSFILGTTKLASGDILMGASNSSKGIIVLTYKKENRMDVFRLGGDAKKGTYYLNLVSKLPCDFPQPLRRLVLVSSHTVLGVSANDEVFLRTGERVCGNIERVFVSGSIGFEDGLKPAKNFDKTTTCSIASTGDVSTPPRIVTPDRTTDSSLQTPTPEPMDEDEQEESFSDDNDGNVGIVESFGPTSSPVVYFIGEKECKFCSSLTKIPKLKRKILSMIQRGNPLVFMQDVNGYIAVWAAASSSRFAGRLEFIVRFEDSTDTACQPIGISGEFGVLASIPCSGSSQVSLTSAIHPILSLIPPEQAYKISTRLEYSPFFGAIVEMWLHSCLSASLPILSKLNLGDLSRDCLLESSDAVCQHSLVRLTLDRLVAAFQVSSHFPSLFASVFAASVRKSEPHVTFPLATCGAFSGKTAEELFSETVGQRRLRDAALLLVIIQEKTGPVVVREKFAIPLFREALIEQDYQLGGEIAHFHFSFSKRLRSPINRDFSWAPDQGAVEDDLVEQMLRSAIETVVLTHLNFLINESTDWLRLIRFIQSLGLVFGDWLLRVPRQEYLDLSQLVTSFRIMLVGVAPGDWSTLVNLLVDGFLKARWLSHWKAVAVATESRSMLRDCLEQTKEDNSSVVTEADVDSIFSKYRVVD
jgi:hypothetical protein